MPLGRLDAPDGLAGGVAKELREAGLARGAELLKALGVRHFQLCEPLPEVAGQIERVGAQRRPVADLTKCCLFFCAERNQSRDDAKKAM